ncbi:hypothetical protein [Novosphingobium taihuense]|nr:hypothetical protein [Novosphingobium taihuense]
MADNVKQRKSAAIYINGKAGFAEPAKLVDLTVHLSLPFLAAMFRYEFWVEQQVRKLWLNGRRHDHLISAAECIIRPFASARSA